MVDLFAHSEGEDDSVSVLAELLGLLLQVFPNEQFTIEALVKKLNTQNILDPETLNGQLLEALHSVGRQPLRAVTPKVVAAVMQRNVKGVPIKDADGVVWAIAPRPRERVTWDKVIWGSTGSVRI